MADSDFVDSFFSNEQICKTPACNTDFALSDTMEQDYAGYDFDWTSSISNANADSIYDDLFRSLLDSNLPDDVKEQQLSPAPKQIGDHAYSACFSPPHSDSGISDGPISPSNSSNSVDDVISMDIEKELFGPLELNKYEQPLDCHPEVESVLDSCLDPSSSPEMYDSQSPSLFDLEEWIDKSPASSVDGFTITTDESTKVIKVISVNNKKSQSLLSTGNNNSILSSMTTKSGYPELRLSDEEKDLLRKEGIVLPSHLPLTRDEEKILRSVRRRIRNKASARNSRKKKQDYMEALEERVKMCTEEKRLLERKVDELERQNTSLIGQLKKLQKLVSDSTKQTAKTGTCAMILALSFALVLLPNYQTFLGSNSTKDSLIDPSAQESIGRPSRSLLSKSEDSPSSDVLKEASSANDIPFFYNKIPRMMSPARRFLDDPVDDDIDPQIPEDNDGKHDLTENIIHMEITKLPENDIVKDTRLKNNIVDEKVEKHKSLSMDTGDNV